MYSIFLQKRKREKRIRESDVFGSSFENLHNVRDQVIFGT
jgi:hypothetical protein